MCVRLPADRQLGAFERYEHPCEPFSLLKHNHTRSSDLGRGALEHALERGARAGRTVEEPVEVTVARLVNQRHDVRCERRRLRMLH
jgi:hypothetical protein